MPKEGSRRSPRPRPIPENIDVAIIGSGLGGLSTALQLALNGYRVCIFESHDVPGGYAHTFRRKKYNFDVSLHYVGGLDEEFMLGGLLAYYGVLDRLEVSRRSELFTVEFPDGSSIHLPNGADGVIETLSGLFPEEKSNLVNLFRHLSLLKYHAIGQYLDPAYAIPLEERLTTQYGKITFLSLLNKFISNPRLIAILGRLWIYIGLPPSQSTATFSTCVFCASFLDGGSHIKGGSRMLSQMMVERLRELGGECLLREPVDKIIVHKGVVKGVRLERGEEVPCKMVVSNANPYQTFFDLIGNDDVSRIYRYRLNKMQPSLSFYSTYIGLDCKASTLGLDYHNYFVACGDDVDEAYRRAVDTELHHSEWSLTNYEGEAHADMCPEGTSVLSIAELTPGGPWMGDIDRKEYRKKKEEVSSILLEKYLKRFPSLRDHIAIHEFATPRTMLRYSHNHQGSVYGLAQTVEQSNAVRLKNRTPIKGLYLTGAWTWSGGGYEGSMVSGVQTAASLMMDNPCPKPIAFPRICLPPRADFLEKHRVVNEPHSEFAVPSKELPQQERKMIESTKDEEQSTPQYLGMDTFYHRVRVYFEDTDEQKICYHGAYIRFIDRARVEAFEALNKQTDFQLLDRYMVNVYSLSIRYLSPALRRDWLDIETKMRVISTHRLLNDQRILRDGALIAHASVELVFVNENRNVMELPAEILALFPKNEQQRSL